MKMEALLEPKNSLLDHKRLENVVTKIFQAAGCQPPEARQIATRLVDVKLHGA